MTFERQSHFEDKDKRARGLSLNVIYFLWPLLERSPTNDMSSLNWQVKGYLLPMKMKSVKDRVK